MFRLKMLLLLKGIKGVDKYLAKSDILHTLKASQAQAFFATYLSKSFDITNKSCFNIFNYLKKRNVFTESQLEELLLNSNYFNTMPSSFAFSCVKELKFLNNYKLKRFTTKYLEMIKDKRELKIITEMYPEYKDLYAPKILASKDISYILSFKDNSKITMNIIENMQGNLPFADLKKFILNCKMDTVAIFNLLNPYFVTNKKAVLEFILDIYKSLYLYRNDMDDNLFFKVLNSNPNLSIEDKDYMAKQVLAIKWKDTHISWLNNVDCSYNFTYLNKYVESNSFSIDFILNLKVEYYRYLKIALYNKGTKFMHEFLNTILANLNHYNFNLINEIIADLSGNLSSFTLTKTDIFNLLNLGVSGDIITNLFRYYYFSESEKLEIYHIFRSQNRDDLIITWGSFLFNSFNLSNEKNNSLKHLA